MKVIINQTANAMALNIPRRFLPSLSTLSAFEAAARTGSVTAAALELNLTQSAVSRQIKALEEQLEIPLFHRERQTIKLTAAGDAYVREIREGLRLIGAASLNLRANPAGGTLNVAAPPSFSMKWLAPRLPKFIKANPDVVLNLVTRTSKFDFRTEAIDAAIHFGQSDWRGTENVFLCVEDVVPACSVALKRHYAFKVPKDLRNAPLLHVASCPDAWEQWLTRHSVAAKAVHGMLFDQLPTAVAAAIAGMGIVLLPIFLFTEELRCRSLVRALDLSMRASSKYFLVWSRDRTGYPPLVAFRRWIVGEAAIKAPS